MSQAPSMPVFTDALLGDTLHLNAEEFGAYCLLLFATWRNNGQAMPDDPDKLARICRVTPRRWVTKLRPVLVSFYDLSDGLWHQKRLEKEWMYCVHTRAKASAAGKASAAARALKDKEIGQTTVARALEPNGQQDANKTSTPIPIPIPIKKLASNLGSRELPSAWGKAAAAERAKAGLPDVDLSAEWAKLLAKTDEPTEARWLAWALKARQKPSGNGSTDPSGLPEVPWPQRCRAWAKGHRWDPDHGPAPDQPGCWAPADLIADALSLRASRHQPTAAE